MDREINLINYLPPVLREVKELVEVSDTENPEVVELWHFIKTVLDDQFVETATEYGLGRLEKIIKETPRGTETLGERRFRVLVRFNERLPYVYRILHRQLTSLCGENGYTLQRNIANKILTVRVNLTAKSNYDAVDELLERMVPQNMIIDLSLLYNQHQTLANFTHAQLGTYTHDQLRNEVLV